MNWMNLFLRFRLIARMRESEEDSIENNEVFHDECNALFTVEEMSNEEVSIEDS